MAQRIVEKYPLWLRISHWLNVPLLFIMAGSGFVLYLGAADEYRVIPAQVHIFIANYQDNFRNFKVGMAHHFVFSTLFFLNIFFYIVMNTWYKRWRHFSPFRAGKSCLRRAFYFVFLIVLGLELLSGLAIYKPAQLSELVFLFGSYQNARIVHIGGLLAVVLVVLIHVVEVCFLGWNTIRGMVAGFEVRNE